MAHNTVISHDSNARNKLNFATVYTDEFQLARKDVINQKTSKLFSDDGITIVLQDVDIKVDMLLIVQINQPIIDLSVTTPQNIERPSSVISTVYNREESPSSSLHWIHLDVLVVYAILKCERFILKQKTEPNHYFLGDAMLLIEGICLALLTIKITF